MSSAGRDGWRSVGAVGLGAVAGAIGACTLGFAEPAALGLAWCGGAGFGAAGLGTAGAGAAGLGAATLGLAGAARVACAFLAASLLGTFELIGLAKALEVSSAKVEVALGLACGAAAGVAALGMLELPSLVRSMGWETPARCAAASLAASALASMGDLLDDDAEIRVSTLFLLVTTCAMATLIAVVPLWGGCAEAWLGGR